MPAPAAKPRTHAAINAARVAPASPASSTPAPPRARRTRRSSTTRPSRSAYLQEPLRRSTARWTIPVPPNWRPRARRRTPDPHLLHVSPLRPGPADGEPARAHRAQGTRHAGREARRCRRSPRPRRALPRLRGSRAGARQGQARRRAGSRAARPRRRSSRCSTSTCASPRPSRPAAASCAITARPKSAARLPSITRWSNVTETLPIGARRPRRRGRPAAPRCGARRGSRPRDG